MKNKRQENKNIRQNVLDLWPARSFSPPDWSGIDELTALFSLSSINGFGPQKFKEVYKAGLSAKAVVEDPGLLPVVGKRGEQLKSLILGQRDNLRGISRERAEKQVKTAEKNNGHILTYSHQAYPLNVFESNNPVPILYVRGSLMVLKERKAVACVGSRGIRHPYQELQRKFSEAACKEGFVIVSGFATGADRIAHEAAYRAGGRTICVMPCGLDRPFPPENKDLFHSLLAYNGSAFVSEFPFGTGASALSLRKRNKLIVAFALGVLIAQSSSTGGGMNAYRFAVEQKKAIATFKHDNSPDTSGNLVVENNKIYGGTSFSARELDTRVHVKWLQKLSSLT